MRRSYLWERLTKLVEPVFRLTSTSTNKKTPDESSVQSEKEVSSNAPPSSNGPSLRSSESMPVVSVDEFSELVQDQWALASEFREKNRFPSELSETMSHSSHTLTSVDEISFSFIAARHHSTERNASMMAENELLRQHYSSMRDLYESERARADMLQDESNRWRAEAKRWRSSSIASLRKLDKLRGAIASERADRMTQIAFQAEKFMLMETKLEEARLHHMIAASALERTRKSVKGVSSLSESVV